MPSAARNLQKRSLYTRTNGDMLTDWMEPPVGVYWLGSDAGGGLTPIGPNGPFASHGPAKPVVTRATSLITGPICSAPFKVLELGFGGQPQPRPRWITDPMLCRADERFPTSDIYPQVLRLSRAQFWVEWLRSAVWWGLGAFVYIEDAFGQPVAGSLKNIAPYTLTTQRTDDGLVWVIGDTQDASNQVIADRDGRLNVGPITYRLCVLRNPHSPVDCEGMSQGVFAMNPTTFMLAGQIDSYASGTFRSGVPAGYLQVQTPGLQQTQADELKRSWLSAHGGDRRSIAVLNAVTSFTPLSISPVDAALGEGEAAQHPRGHRDGLRNRPRGARRVAREQRHLQEHCRILGAAPRLRDRALDRRSRGHADRPPPRDDGRQGQAWTASLRLRSPRSE